MKIDKPTANLSTPSVARVCVELDLLKVFPARVWIGIGVRKRFWQSFLFENLLSYCSHCKKIGHDPSSCKKLSLAKA